MDEVSSAVEEIIRFVAEAMAEKISDIQMDKTVWAKISESTGGGRYKVRYAGNEYTAFALGDASYEANDTVAVTFMEGARENIIILGKKQ